MEDSLAAEKQTWGIAKSIHLKYTQNRSGPLVTAFFW